MHINYNHKLPSLRSRYLLLSGIIAVILLIGAITGHYYVNEVSGNNQKALKLRDNLASTISEIRNTFSSINLVLNNILINPEPTYNTDLEQQLKTARELTRSLLSNTDISADNIRLLIQKLNTLLIDLEKNIHHLTEQRKDAEWVYPVLPFIRERLFLPNSQFVNAADQAILELPLTMDSLPVRQQLEQLRNLWQKKILNFRASIIRYAGLNTTSDTQQDLNVIRLRDEIQSLLTVLLQDKINGKLELQTEDSLDKMIAASERWDQQWLEVKKIRSSSTWRNDIRFLNQQITPLQVKIAITLHDLEKVVYQWSAVQSDKVNKAAKEINNELWILSLLALSFVIVVYLMIEKFILKPISRISVSLSEEGHEHHFLLEDKSSQEIFSLTSAFNAMRRQIHQRQIALEHQATHDGLTGLPNRILMNDRLNQAISLMRRNYRPLSFMLLDLDRFKVINDSLGHHIGDILLQQVAERLQKSLRESDSVARLGGDEFAIIAPDTSSEQAEKFAAKIINAIKEVFIINHQNLYVGASIGIAIYPDHGNDCNTLTRHADTAMYVAKQNNSGYSFYNFEADANTQDNLSLVGDLHAELKNAQNIQVHYQPQIHLHRQSVSQLEALFRWHHPQKGFISPEDIINIGEHSGLIAELTSWVLNRAISEFMTSELINQDIKLAINLSAWNLQDPEFVDTVSQVLQQNNMPASRLTLEITETAMMHDPLRAREVLKQLDEMGILLSIDDYGTGFSSLSYLKLLPVGELKIDKSFIMEMLNDDNDAIIVHSTIELAHNLGYDVVAEGVENKETLEKLRLLNCDFAQGYYIQKPAPINAITDWINTTFQKDDSAE